MEFVRNRLKTLHIIMLALLGFFAIAGLVYFSRADVGVYQASDVLGQFDPPYNSYPKSYIQGDPWNGAGSTNDVGFKNPSSVAIDPTNLRMYVADPDDNRVLVFSMNTDGTLVDTNADYVLGQTDFISSSPGIDDSHMNTPTAVAFETTYGQLFVADTGNNRVLSFATTSLFSGMSADYVVGQSDLFSNTPANGNAGLNSPRGVDVDSTGQLFVADTGNNRVMVFDGYAGQGGIHGQAGLFVLGQPTFNVTTAGTTDSIFSAPVGVATNAVGVLISDTGNNRVLFYATSDITGTGANATSVLGQVNFTTAGGGTGSAELNTPKYADYDYTQGVILVSDTGNNRISAYNVGSVSSFTNGIAADYELGQASFGDTSPAITQNGLSSPMAFQMMYMLDAVQSSFEVPGVRRKVYVVDSAANRVLTYTYTSASDLAQANAIDVIGQFTTVNNPMGTTPVFTLDNVFSGDTGRNNLGFDGARKSFVDTVNHRLFIVNRGDAGSRSAVVVYDLDSTNNLIDHVADHIIGQTDFNYVTLEVSQDSFGAGVAQGINSLAYDTVNDRLFVSDPYRVLVFDVRPSGSAPLDTCGVVSTGLTDGMNASCVMGQPDFTSINSLVSNRAQIIPIAIEFDSLHQRLFVANSALGAKKISVFDLAAGIANNPLATAIFASPTIQYEISDLAYDTNHNLLYVGDNRMYDVSWTGGSVVWIYDMSSPADSMNPIAVLGTSHTSDDGSGHTTSDMVADADQCGTYTGTHNEVWSVQTICDQVGGLGYDALADVLYVGMKSGDAGGPSRILVFDTSNITTNMPASAVLGQQNFTDTTTNGISGFRSTNLTVGFGVDSTHSRVYASEGNRVLVYQFVKPDVVTLPDGQATLSYTSSSLTASQSQGAVTYTAYSGLPAGLSLAGGGIVSGTPTTAGSYNLLVRAVDTFASAGTFFGARTYPITITSAPGGGGTIGGGVLCQDATATNYLQSGSCTYTSPVMCTNPVATNYGQGGVCIFPLPPIACADPLAINNGLVGVCIYPNPVPVPNPTPTPTPGPGSQTDACDNIAGVQLLVPSGMTVQNHICLSPLVQPVDTSISPAVVASMVKKTSRLGLILGSLAAFFAGSIVLSELAFLPQRIWQLLLGALGFKKRIRRWGTVYDSITKQPLDPVYVSLYDKDGKEVATSITDIDGRFGFLLQPGRYTIVVHKTNYLFPSRELRGKTSDEVYGDLYFGEPFVVQKGDDAIAKNIPMDPLLFNWNEYVKHEQKLTKWNARKDKIINRVLNILFVVGFIASIVGAIIEPITFNFAIVGIYLVLLLIRELGMRAYRTGSVITKKGVPLPYGLIHIYSAKIGKKLFTRPLDNLGRYYALVPKGQYYIEIATKNADQSYTEIFKSDVFRARRGVINKRFTV